MTRIFVVLALMAGLLLVGSPAQAHTSVCNGGWGLSSVSSDIIHVYGSVQCGPGWHASKQTAFTNIQVKQKTLWWTSWKNMYPILPHKSYFSGMKFEAHAPCLDGTHTYRAQARHTQEGFHGLFTKKFNGTPFVIKCDR